MAPATPHPILTDWLDELHRQGKSDHTLAAYRRALTHFARWSEGSYGQPFDPAQVIPRDVRDWQAYQQTVARSSPNTINQRLVALSRFFAWAVGQGHAVQDPTAAAKSLRLPKRQPKALSPRQQRRLLRAVHAGGVPRDIALMELLLGTGLRVGELLALRIGDLTLQPRSGEVIVRRGKHGGQRRVPLTAPVRNALHAYLATHPTPTEPTAPLWHGERGPLQSRSGVSRLLTKYCRAAQMDDAIGPHTLRHTFATRYLDANPSDLRGLAALLGHASLETVMIYTEPSTDDLAQRLARMEGGDDGA